MSPRKSAEVVTVARAIVEDGHVRVEPCAPDEIHIHRDEALKIQVAFEFREEGTEQEEFHVRLRSRLGDQIPRPAVRDIADHPIVNDSEKGTIFQELEAPARRDRLYLDVHADYGHRIRKRFGLQAAEQADVAWSIPVIVDA